VTPLIIGWACLAAAIVAVTFVSTTAAYPELPESIPLHFNITGAVDQWGSRPFIWLLPAVQVVTVGVFVFAYAAIRSAAPPGHGAPPSIAPFAVCELAILWRAQTMVIDAAKRSSHRADIRPFWVWFAVLLPLGLVAMFALR